MKSIGVREFTDHADALINGDEPLILESHGSPVGVYLPLPRADRAAAAAAAAKLEAALSAIRNRLGLTEDELVATLLEPLDEVHSCAWSPTQVHWSESIYACAAC